MTTNQIKSIPSKNKANNSSIPLYELDSDDEPTLELRQLDEENSERDVSNLTDDIEVIEIKINEDENSEMDAEELYDDSSCTEDVFDDIANIHIQEDTPYLPPLDGYQNVSVKDEKLDSEEMAILQHDLNTKVKDSVGENECEGIGDFKNENNENPQTFIDGQNSEHAVDENVPVFSEKKPKSSTKSRNRLRICHLCGKNYFTESGFRHHMVMHQDPNFFCHLCGRVFYESQNLKKHLAAIHSEERPFQCHMCGTKYKRRDVLQEHIKRVHDGVKRVWNAEILKKYRCKTKKAVKERFQCPHCNKCMASKTYLNDHINGVHIKEKLYQCNECDMSFTRKASFKYHFKRAHIEKKQILEPRGTFLKDCEYCGLQFQIKKYYEIHVASKHFNKYPCEHCNQVFDNKNHLSKHRESDHAAQLSKCDLCGKCFAEDVHLKRHIYLCHTKRNPYECYHCGYKANKKSTLAVHMRRHTGEKPYQCDICSRRFSQSVDYRKHRANHFKNRADERDGEIKIECMNYFIQSLDVTVDEHEDKTGIRFETVHTADHVK